MEITADRLVQIIGGMYVEMAVMRAEIERLRAELAQYQPKDDKVAPLRPQ